MATRHAAEEFEPARIAVDSLSALEGEGPDASFRDFRHRLTSFIKSRQIVGLFTASTETLLGGASFSETRTSILADSIIGLRYDVVGIRSGDLVVRADDSTPDG